MSELFAVLSSTVLKSYEPISTLSARIDVSGSKYLSEPVG